MRLMAYAIIAVLVGGAGCALETGDPSAAQAVGADGQPGTSKLPGESNVNVSPPAPGKPVQTELVVDDNPEPSPWEPPNIPGSTGSTSSQTQSQSTTTKTNRARQDNGVHIIGPMGERDLPTDGL